MKRCPKCGLEKDLSKFSIDRRREDGRYHCCKECRKKARSTIGSKKSQREYYLDNRERILSRVSIRYENKKEEIAEYASGYYKKNTNKIRLRVKDYNSRTENKLKRNEREYLKRQTDLNFKLKETLRKRLNKALKNGQKTGSAVKDLGCSIDEFKEYLERKFEIGMAWDNYGRKGWHIDHIKPLDSFDLTYRDQLLEACHYTNLQPLWWKDNLSKGAKCGN